MQNWKNGEISDLLYEGRTIQQRFHKSRHNNKGEQQLVKTFSKLMFQGKVTDAIRILTKHSKKGGFVALDKTMTVNGCTRTVREILIEKHPKGQPADMDTTVTANSTSTPMYHPIIFDSIDGQAIRSAALHVQGAAGPSGVDARAWRRYCTSFGRASDDLCSALASIAKKICTTYVDPTSLAPYTACRLIALEKDPGIRPIGIGEVVRRIIGKAVLKVIRSDILQVTGNSQLCAGQEAGIESAVHVMRNPPKRLF